MGNRKVHQALKRLKESLDPNSYEQRGFHQGTARVRRKDLERLIQDHKRLYQCAKAMHELSQQGFCGIGIIPVDGGIEISIHDRTAFLGRTDVGFLMDALGSLTMRGAFSQRFVGEWQERYDRGTKRRIPETFAHQGNWDTYKEMMATMELGDHKDEE